MIKNIIALVLIMISLGTSACGTVDNGADAGNQDSSKNTTVVQAASSGITSYSDIKPDEAKKRLDSKEEIILLDVRTPEEYAEKHIPNSMLIPVEVIESEAPSKLTDKNATIFVYCRSGRRSVTAAEALIKMGYTKVYNLGGINDWTYETESGK